MDPKLRGDRVEVRYDPFHEIETVLIYSPAGEYLGIGKRHHREKTIEPPIAQPGKPKHNYLDLLIEKHKQSLDNTSPAVFKGGADCVGGLYFPANHVQVDGNVLCSMLMADTIELSSNAKLTVNPNYPPSE